MPLKKFSGYWGTSLVQGASSETIGNLSDLTTTDKTNVVSAVNEVNGKFPVSIADGGTGGTTATEARTSLGVMTGVQLYYNASGSSGTIELSDEIKNYQCIEICFHVYIYSGLSYGVARIHNLGENAITTGLTINVAGTYTSGGTSKPRVNAFAGNTSISGNSLTHASQNRAYITDNTTPVVEETTTDIPKIYKIIGYKY